jgi:hypothetical protein
MDACSFTENEFESIRHADGLEQPLPANAVGQGREVAHVPAVALAHQDVSYLEFLQHGTVCDHTIAPQLLDLDTLSLEVCGQPLFQTRQRLSQRVGPVVLEGR